MVEIKKGNVRETTGTYLFSGYIYLFIQMTFQLSNTPTINFIWILSQTTYGVLQNILRIKNKSR